MVLASAAGHAAWNFAARRASGDFGVLWVGLCAAALVGAPLAWATADAATARVLPLLAASSAVNALYFAALAAAYERGELSEVYPATRGSGVLWSALASRLLLGERLGRLGAAGIACVCAGLWLARRPAGEAGDKEGALPFALAAGVCIGAAGLIDKVAMRAAGPGAYLVGLFAGAALFSAPYAWLRRGEECRRALRSRKALSALIGVASMASYGLILAAFRAAPLGLVAALRESSLLFGVALGVAFLGERLTLRRAAGVAVLTGGLALIRMV